MGGEGGGLESPYKLWILDTIAQSLHIHNIGCHCSRMSNKIIIYSSFRLCNNETLKIKSWSHMGKQWITIASLCCATMQQWRWCHMDIQTMKLVYLHFAIVKTENINILKHNAFFLQKDLNFLNFYTFKYF